MFAILAGLAVIAASPEGPIEQVCGYALDAVDGKPSEDSVYERYIGRMEVRMMDLKYTDRQKEGIRIVCEAYLRGAAHGMKLVLKTGEAPKTASR